MPPASRPTPSRRRRALLGSAVVAMTAGSLIGCAQTPTAEPSAQPSAPPLEAIAAAAPQALLGPAVLPRLVTEKRAVPHFPTGAMPVGDLPGWKQTLAQDFLGKTVPGGFATYEGQPGGDPYGWWKHKNVIATGDDLKLHGSWEGDKFVTGGLMQLTNPQTYGKYEVRFKVDKGAGVSYALLLWPTYGHWPDAGEIDFAEDGGGSRSHTTATMHYGWDNEQVQHTLKADFSQFQTVGVEWTPGKLVYTLNGKPWATVRSSNVPTHAMNLVMQLEAGHGTTWSDAPSRATPANVDLTVDWVVAYQRS